MKCIVCGKNADSKYCFRHKPRKAFKKTGTLRKAKVSTRDIVMMTDRNAAKRLEMSLFFVALWEKRPHISEISGTYLGKEPLSVYFHHILAKSKYPELALKEDNIILLTLEEHDNVEMDMYKYPEVNKRREKLIDKYLNDE